MVQVIPAINAETWEDVLRKIRIVEPYVDWLHIDVADGTFTPNSLWHNPRDLIGFETKCHVEIHLMADRPEDRVGSWLQKPVERLIVHVETVRDFHYIAGQCREQGSGIGLAADSHTSWTALTPFAGAVDLLQVLAVHAGKGGQEFERHNLVKIKHLRAQAPRAIIEADGGMTPALAAECQTMGANIVVAGAYIFDHPSPKMAIRELQMTND